MVEAFLEVLLALWWGLELIIIRELRVNSKRKLNEKVVRTQKKISLSTISSEVALEVVEMMYLPC